MADAEIDLLRSSLDLLVLKALTWAPMHGYAISEWIESATASLLLVGKARSTRHCIASSDAVGSRRTGVCRTTTAEQSSTS